MDKPVEGFRYQLIGWFLVLAAFISSYMNGWLVSLDRGVWLDEALTAFFIEQSWPGLFALISDFEANMSLYYVSLKIWAAAFSSEIGLRLFSFLAYLSTAAIFCLAIRRISGIRTAIIFLVLFFGHFYLIRYSVEVRSYAFAAFCLAGLWYCWLCAVLGGRGRWWFVYAVIGVLAVHVHFFVSLGVFSLGITALLFRTPSFVFRHWFMAHSAIGLSFVPIVFFVTFQEKGQLAWLATPGFRSLLDTAFMYSGAAPQASDWVRRSLLLLCLIFSGWAVLSGNAISLARAGRDFSVKVPIIASLISIAVLPVFLIFLLSQFEPAFSRRFFIPFVPFFLILVSLGISTFDYHKAFIVSLIMLILMTLSAASYSQRPYVPWQEVVGNMMLERCNGTTGILFMTPNAQSIFNFYEKRKNLDKQCNWRIHPYKMTSDNYVRSPESYPDNLEETKGSEFFWVVETHLSGNETESYQRYLRRIRTEYSQCSVVIQNRKLTLTRCSAP